MPGGESRNVFHPGGTNHVFWELGGTCLVGFGVMNARLPVTPRCACLFNTEFTELTEFTEKAQKVATGAHSSRAERGHVRRDRGCKQLSETTGCLHPRSRLTCNAGLTEPPGRRSSAPFRCNPWTLRLRVLRSQARSRLCHRAGNSVNPVLEGHVAGGSVRRRF